MTFSIWNVTLLKNEPFMSYQRFNKGGRVAKSLFLAKSVQKLLKKTDFFQKRHCFESLITHKRSIFEHGYISYGKRQKSCTLLVILSYLTFPIFNSSSKSTGFFFFCKRGSTILKARMIYNRMDTHVHLLQ